MESSASPSYQAGYELGKTVAPLFLAVILLVVVGFFIFSIIKACKRKSAGWIISSVISGVLAIVGILGGLGLAVGRIVEKQAIAANGGGKSTLVTGKSGTFTIEMPSNWGELPQLIKESDAQLAVGNGRRELYTIVLEESKQDIESDLEGYDNLVLTNMKAKMSGAELSEVTIRTLNGLPARQHRLEGSFDRIGIVYHIATVESPDAFYQVLTWTLRSKEPTAKPILEEVINSFKVLPSSGTVSSGKSTPGSAQTAQSTETRLRNVTAKLLDLDPSVIKLESTLEKDLGADDFDIVELVMAVDEEFGVEIADEDAAAMTTFGDLVRLIDQGKSK